MTSDPGIQEKRERILNGAIRAFAERGFHDCRVSDIARAAGVSHGLVYHYFRSKDDVLLSIFHDRWSVFVRMARQLLGEQGSACEKLGTIIGFLVDSFQAHPDLMKVLLRDLVRSSDFFARSNIDAMEEGLEVIQGIVRQGMESGELRSSIDPRLASYVFYGGLQEVVGGWVWRGVSPDENDDDVKARLADVLLGGLRAAPAGTAQ